MSATPLIRIGEARESEPALSWSDRLERLRERLRSLPGAVVAYSGGVDSSVLLRVAHEVLGERAIGVIGRSDSYAKRELDLALDQAAAFGARVEVVSTGELSDPAFRANDTDRCYHCKTELYRKLAGVAERMGAAVVDGTIVDDLSDWRPGRKAAEEIGVMSPLADVGFTKAEVRAVAAFYGLDSRDKPASPCLASRIPYGTEISRENLSMVERAEELLRSLGFDDLRVRHHGEIARVEVPARDLARLVEPGCRERVVSSLKAIGYRFIALDLEGFRSGSLNPTAPGKGEMAAKP